MRSGEFMAEVNVPYCLEILWWTKNDSYAALLPVERKDRRGIFDISTRQKYHFDL